MKNIFPTASALFVAATPLFADITVRFQEGAPTDRFVINSDCTANDVAMTIDLAGSVGSLIFDVTADGAGVEVFQPVSVQSGTAILQPVVDGDQRLTMTLPFVPSDEGIVISADLDDVLANSALGQIRVSGSELDGASITMTIDGQSQTAVFAAGTRQVSLEHGCLS